MPPFETFFAFGFVSTLTVAVVTTGWRYLPVLIVFDRLSIDYQPILPS